MRADPTSRGSAVRGHSLPLRSCCAPTPVRIQDAEGSVWPEMLHGGERQSSHCLLYPGHTASISFLTDEGKGGQSVTMQNILLWEMVKGFPPPP